MNELFGIDVSNHQGLILWSSVAASDHSFAFIKASEDPSYLDAWFEANWAECKRAGMTRGAYHFARPSLSSPAESVTLFQQALARLGLGEGDLIALDIEDEDEETDRDLSQWVAEWLTLAEQVFGVRPVIYSGRWYMELHGLENPAFGQYPLWLASYQSEPPPAPKGWDRLTFWQNSYRGVVPGVITRCDTDTFFGTMDDLRRLGKPAPPLDVDVIEAGVWSPLYLAIKKAWLYKRQELGDAVFAALTADKARLGR